MQHEGCLFAAPQFPELEPFAQQWAVMGMDARARARDESSMEEKWAFYAAMDQKAETVLRHVAAKPLAGLDVNEQHLVAMLLSYAHVALTLEGREGQEAEHVACRREMVLTRIPQVLPMELRVSSD